jgi:hypothetical protein
VWSINRPLPSPEAGRYATAVSPRDAGFHLSFTVAGNRLRDAVLAWQAPCASGGTIGTQVDQSDAPTSAWTTGSSYNLPMDNGEIAHVHAIRDTGRFLDSSTAAGVLSLSVAVTRSGQTVDRCATGTVRWIARRQA